MIFIKPKVSIQLIDLDMVVVNSESIKLIPKELAIKYSVFPFDFKNNCICLAMIDPSNLEIINLVKLLSKKEIITFQATENQIHNSIKMYYERIDAEKAVADLKEEFMVTPTLESQNFFRTPNVENAPAVKLTDSIINEGVMIGASDIHIEPFEKDVAIRYRKDGVLFKAHNTIPLEIYSAVSTRIKILANMDISEKRYPQDGKLQRTVGDSICDMRVSSLPTIHGEKFVIRILYKSTFYCNIEKINFSMEQRDLIYKILQHNYGMVLITGPTGSGKSTTLYAMLNALNTAEKNVVTIEDPVEYQVDGINQVNVNVKAGVSFAVGLRSILRQDPDIIMLGEVRDEETASISVRAAITGHLVLSTLHTNDSIGSINRLIDMGVPKYMVADSLIAVIAQRLIRLICPDCKSEYTASEKEKRILGLDTRSVLFKGAGCNKCYYSGYSGRHAVCEILYIDSNLKDMIQKGVGSEMIKQYLLKSNMKLLPDNCKSMVRDGLTTFEEYSKLCNGDMI